MVKNHYFFSVFLAIFPILINMSGMKYIISGNVEPKVRQKIIKTLYGELRKDGFTGKIEHFEDRHAGFSQFGIDASFDYVEKHKDIEIKKSIDFRCDDSGVLETDEEESDNNNDYYPSVETILEPLKSVSTQQPEAQREEKRVKKIIIQNEKKGLYTFDGIEMTFFTDSNSITSDQKEEEKIKLLDDIAKKNQSGSLKQWYAAGYYSIPLAELKAHEFYYYKIGIKIGDPRARNFQEENFAEFLIEVFNQSKIPDGQYQFDLSADDKTSGSYLYGTINIIVKNGVASLMS